MEKQDKDSKNKLSRLGILYGLLVQRIINGKKVDLQQLETIAKKGHLEIGILPAFLPGNDLLEETGTFIHGEIEFTVFKILKESVGKVVAKNLTIEFDFLEEEIEEHICKDELANQELAKALRKYAWFEKRTQKTEIREEGRVYFFCERTTQRRDYPRSQYAIHYKIPAPHKHDRKERFETCGKRWNPIIPVVLHEGDIVIVVKRSKKSKSAPE